MPAEHPNKVATLIGPAKGHWRGQCYVYELEPPITHTYLKTVKGKNNGSTTAKMTGRIKYVAVSAVDLDAIMAVTAAAMQSLGHEPPVVHYGTEVLAFPLAHPDDTEPVSWAEVAGIKNTDSHAACLSMIGYTVQHA